MTAIYTKLSDSLVEIEYRGLSIIVDCEGMDGTDGVRVYDLHGNLLADIDFDSLITNQGEEHVH